MADYASAWRAADKVVYSSTLAAPFTAKTRLERHFSPALDRGELIGVGAVGVVVVRVEDPDDDASNRYHCCARDDC